MLLLVSPWYQLSHLILKTTVYSRQDNLSSVTQNKNQSRALERLPHQQSAYLLSEHEDLNWIPRTCIFKKPSVGGMNLSCWQWGGRDGQTPVPATQLA